MINLTFLGTSAMQPTKERNHSAFLLTYKKENILFDCGEGTQRQLRIAGLKPAKITKLCISHWHGDHVFGIAGLLSSMGADGCEKTLHIYGPPGTKTYLDHLFKSFGAKDIIPYQVHEALQGVMCDTEDFLIEAQKLKHSIPCIGYAFIEKDRRKIAVAKAQKLGLQGPILGKIQQGKTVTKAGKKIKPDDVSYLIAGKKISYIADTVVCQGAAKLAKDADILISEGTHLDCIRQKSQKYLHLTVKEAALLASENNAKKLIITHISQRYKDVADLVEEAQTYFPGAIIAHDFLKVKI